MRRRMGISAAPAETLGTLVLEGGTVYVAAPSGLTLLDIPTTAIENTLGVTVFNAQDFEVPVDGLYELWMEVAIATGVAGLGMYQTGVPEVGSDDRYLGSAFSAIVAIQLGREQLNALDLIAPELTNFTAVEGQVKLNKLVLKRVA